MKSNTTEFKDLITLSDYVLDAWIYVVNSKDPCDHNTEQLRHIIAYTKFLKQPLKLSMFIPCVDGEPIEEPDWFSGLYDDNGYGDTDKLQYKKDCEQYQKALSEVLFEGFELLMNNKVLTVMEVNNIRLVYYKQDDSFRTKNKSYQSIEDLTNLNIKAKY